MVCVTVDDLTRCDDGEAVMSKHNYDYHIKKNKFIIIRPGKGLGSYALIDYATLPERFRIRIEAKYGNPADIIKEEAMKETMIIDTKARKYYAEEYILPNGEHLSEEKISEYTINASVLNELITILSNRTTMRKALGGSTQKLWETVTGTVEKLRLSYGHTLPENHARLKDKINTYKRDGYESLISRKLCNEYSLKITEEAGNQIIALKRSRVPVYTNEQIFREFNRLAAIRGWKELKSIKSLTQFLGRPEVEPLWYDAVHGELKAHQRYVRKNKTILPQLRDALWYGDGTKVNLFYRDYIDGKLVVRTTNVYEVMDAATEVLLGFHISEIENSEQQYYAFRMAVETAAHRPYELVVDNQGGHKKNDSIGFLSNISLHHRFTAPNSGQSKTIESAFGRFQAEVLHKDWRFTGQNITARRSSSRPNMEFVNANKESLFTLQELKAEYAKARREWNSMEHFATKQPRKEMYLQSINEKTPSVDNLDMIELFWQTTPIPSTYTSAGITIQVDGRKYTYEVYGADGMPDNQFYNENTFRKFHVRYDPMNMTEVRLYVNDSSGMRYVATARPFAQIHRALQDQAPGEMTFFRAQDERNKKNRVDRQMAAAALEMAHGVAPEQHGLNRPKIQGLNVAKVERIMDDNLRKAKQEKASELNIPTSPGEYEKYISNITHDKIQAYNKF